MASVRISPKYQVVIPKEVRERMGLKPGQQLEVLDFDGHIELVPLRDIKELRGAARGIDTRVLRDKKDRV
jgi:AbrB family looped-hinge helix DNA binding protein